MSRSPGQPTKLKPEVKDRFLNAVRIGMPLAKAAQMAGINLSSYYHWMRRGEEEKSGIYFQFFQEANKAHVEAMARLLSKVQAATDDDWKAASWILERRWPDEWGQRMELRGDAKKPVRLQIEWPDDLHAASASGPDDDPEASGEI